MWTIIVALLLWGIQLGYWWYLYKGLKYKGLNLVWDSPATDPPCSLIMCARNELEALRINLESVLLQDLTTFEVIVVDDGSSDGSIEWLIEQQSKYPHLRVLRQEGEPGRGKKPLLEMAIRAASYENIVLTDADCSPASKAWARKLAANLDAEHELAGGYSPYLAESGVVNLFSRYENLITAVQYLGYAAQGHPYMAVGRNLAYTKGLISSLGYFEGHKGLRQGDDELTVQQGLRQTGINYCLNPASFVYTRSPGSFKAYLTQKIRHLAAGKLYSRSTLLSLGVFSLSWALFYIVLLLLVLEKQYYFALLIYLSRLSLMLIAVQYYKNILHQKLSIFQIITFDVFFPPVMGIISVVSVFKPNIKWK